MGTHDCVEVGWAQNCSLLKLISTIAGASRCPLQSCCPIVVTTRSLFYIEDNEQDYCYPTYNSAAPRHQLEAGDACASGGEQQRAAPL